MWCIWRERNARSFDDRENGLLDLKKLVLQTLYSWRVAWHTSIVSTFFGFMFFFLYGLGVLLYTSCVHGLRPSARCLNIHYLSKDDQENHEHKKYENNYRQPYIGKDI
jgi:hypothetical protein